MIRRTTKTTAYYSSNEIPETVPSTETADTVEVTVIQDGCASSSYVFLRRINGTYLRYSGPIGWLTEER